MRVVIDTNILVSAFVFRGIKPTKCFQYVLRHGDIIFTNETFSEFKNIYNHKFGQKISIETRRSVLTVLSKFGRFVDSTVSYEDCRDPKDNMFLEAAVSGKADYIITGDKDLRVLSPFREIPILSPDEFLSHVTPMR